MMEGKRKALVVGAGNLAVAMAAHLSINGYIVHMTNRTMSKLDPLKGNGGKINITGITNDVGEVSLISDDMGALLYGVKLVIVAIPATGHKTVAKSMKGYLKPGTHVILDPGHTFGALEFHSILGEEDGKGVVVSELESSMLTCRAVSVTEVQILAIKKHLGIASMPAKYVEEAVDLLSPLYKDYLEVRESVLVTSLSNLNAIVHPIVTMLNCSTIDNHHKFLYYRQGVSPCVASMLERADMERIAIGHAMGVEVTSLYVWVKRLYEGKISGSGLYDCFHTNDAYEAVMSPNDLETRYIWEDIPTGMLPMIECAELFEVPIPILSTVYSLACILFQKDWKENARTLSSLGLNNLSAEELKEYAITGKRTDVNKHTK